MMFTSNLFVGKTLKMALEKTNILIAKLRSTTGLGAFISSLRVFDLCSYILDSGESQTKIFSMFQNVSFFEKFCFSTTCFLSAIFVK